MFRFLSRRSFSADSNKSSKKKNIRYPGLELDLSDLEVDRMKDSVNQRSKIIKELVEHIRGITDGKCPGNDNVPTKL